MTPQPLTGGMDIVGSPSWIREDQMHIWEVGDRKCPFQMEKAVCVNKEQLEYEAVRTSAQVAQVGTTHPASRLPGRIISCLGTPLGLQPGLVSCDGVVRPVSA